MAKTASAPGVDRDWEVENAVDTLIRAEEIRNDAKLMKKVRPALARRQKQVAAAANRIGAKIMDAG